ncbi:helix-turn-helix domain-containing protein [Acidihalobacter prosperus]|uniref:helix-turn-helix domain-containing protein n=1 Tax=Acidihalobacter prosperus TaxID=160660 RepID=UPI000504310D|nr:helix-turn-helix transcriptional regulator [Acidihalobacter prosperus]
MSTSKRSKKAAQLDWHPADVVAALRKAGWSLRRLSTHHGYAPTSLKEALHKRWPKAERLIADAIGKQPAQIWPSRYPNHNARQSKAA